VLAASGVAASLFVGVLAIGSFVGKGSGADSPEGAVRQLTEAVAREDALSAADVLAPEEVRSLRGTVEGAQKRAKELDLAKSASAPFEGLDISVDGLDLTTESLGTGFAKVSVVGGTISARTHKGDFSPLMQRVLRNSDVGNATSDLATVRRPSTFVMTVQHDGHWYVSAAYTVLEYIREGRDLPAADFGSGQKAVATLGADSPDAAVKEGMQALAAGDFEKLFSLAPPDEIPLYDYRAALTELYKDTNSGFTIDKLETTASVDGDTAKVALKASGTTKSDSDRWSIDGACLRFPGEIAPGAVANSTCSSAVSILPFAFGAPGNGSDARITVVRQHGRWFVSPVATVLDLVDHTVSSITERSLYTFLNIPDQLPPDGALALGQPVPVPQSGFGASVFTYAGHKGEQLLGLGRITPADPQFDGYPLEARIFGPDGVELDNSYGLTNGEPVTLPADGTYKFVLQSYFRDSVFTIWSAADAPDAAKHPDKVGGIGECVPGIAGQTLCKSSSSGSSTATSVPNATSSATTSTVPGG
jgi:hypothetical protein